MDAEPIETQPSEKTVVTFQLPLPMDIVVDMLQALSERYEDAMLCEPTDGAVASVSVGARKPARFAESDMPRMDAEEFQAEGYLHEINRRFLHPHGLAMEVMSEPDGVAYGGIWDFRSDPEGIAFSNDTLEPRKAANINRLWEQREPERLRRLGFMIQPVDPE